MKTSFNSGRDVKYKFPFFLPIAQLHSPVASVSSFFGILSQILDQSVDWSICWALAICALKPSKQHSFLVWTQHSLPSLDACCCLSLPDGEKLWVALIFWGGSLLGIRRARRNHQREASSLSWESCMCCCAMCWLSWSRHYCTSFCFKPVSDLPSLPWRPLLVHLLMAVNISLGGLHPAVSSPSTSACGHKHFHRNPAIPLQNHLDSPLPHNVQTPSPGFQNSPWRETTGPLAHLFLIHKMNHVVQWTLIIYYPQIRCPLPGHGFYPYLFAWMLSFAPNPSPISHSQPHCRMQLKGYFSDSSSWRWSLLLLAVNPGTSSHPHSRTESYLKKAGPCPTLQSHGPRAMAWIAVRGPGGGHCSRGQSLFLLIYDLGSQIEV